MPNFSKSEVILVRYPFSDLTAAKIRPAVVVNDSRVFADYLIVPLTSRTSSLQAGEFALADWRAAGLNMPSAMKWGGLYGAC
jgi:mRNA interferase MazF